MVELFANSGHPDQTPHAVASDLGLHCLPLTRLGVSSLQRINEKSIATSMNGLKSKLAVLLSHDTRIIFRILL